MNATCTVRRRVLHEPARARTPDATLVASGSPPPLRNLWCTLPAFWGEHVRALRSFTQRRLLVTPSLLSGTRVRLAPEPWVDGVEGRGSGTETRRATRSSMRPPATPTRTLSQQPPRAGRDLLDLEVVIPAYNEEQ